jgi:ABC-type long-subunit fatty acid transport system fused permease/ATPase subunit
MRKVTINKKRHIIKAITWNLLAMTTTFFVLSFLPPYFGFESLDKSSVGWLVIVDRLLKLIFYYAHERTWFSSNWGVIKPPKN